jgi:UDP-glucose 4-epimerase
LVTIDAEPRPGDVAGGYTKSDRAAELLGWTPKLSLEDGIRSALDWISVRNELLKD